MSHHSFTNLHFWLDLNLAFERNHFPIQRFHSQDMAVVVIELDTVDPSKQLLQVSLDHSGVGRLAKNLKKVIISDEVEPGER